MSAEKSAASDPGYVKGIVVGAIIGAALFWVTMQLLIAAR